MANDLTKNPFFVDTQGAGAIWTEALFIRKIRWRGATTAGHLVEVQDQNGETVWKSEAAGANYVESEDFSDRNGVRTDGLIVNDLDSGVLEIYYR